MLALVVSLCAFAVFSSASDGETVYFKYYNKSGDTLTHLGDSNVDTINTYLLTTQGGKTVNYIVLEEDCFQAKTNLEVSSEIWIDLNGKKLTFDGGSEVTQERFSPKPEIPINLFSSATDGSGGIVKGHIDIPAANLFYANAVDGMILNCENLLFTGSQTITDMRCPGTLTFKNCDIDYSGATVAGTNAFTFAHRSAFTDPCRLIFIDCTLKGRSDAAVFSFGGSKNSGATAAEIWLENTVIDTAGTAFSLANVYGGDVNIYADETSVIKAAAGKILSITAPTYPESHIGYNLNLSVGARLSEQLENNTSYGVLAYKSITFGSTVTLGDFAPHGYTEESDGSYKAVEVTKNVATVYWHLQGSVASTLVFEDVIPSYDYSYSTSEFKGGKPTVLTHVGWAATEGGAPISSLPKVTATDTELHYYSVLSTVDAMVAIYSSDEESEQTFVRAYEKAEISSEIFSTVPNGGLIKLYKDAVTVSGTATQITFTKEFILDLGGFSLTKTNLRFGSGSPEAHLTVRNGKVVTDGQNFLYLDSGGRATAENLEISSNSSVVFDVRRDTLEVINCTFDVDGSILGCGSRGGSPVIIFSGCTVKSTLQDSSIFSISSTTNKAPAEGYDNCSSVTVTDCTIDAPEASLIFVGSKIMPTSTPSFKLINSAANCKTVITNTTIEGFNDSGIDATYVFEKCRLSALPSAEVGKILLGEKGDLVAAELIGDDTYSYYICQGTSAGFNISLYTSFNISLYLPKDKGFSGFYLDGSYYSLSTLTDTYTDASGKEFYVLTKTDVPASEAGKSISFGIEYTADGYTVSYSLDVSVLAYAKEILNDQSGKYTSLKPLMASVVSYIDAAYNHFNPSGEGHGQIKEALSSEAALYLEKREITPTESDTSALAGIVDNARFKLDSEIKLMLTLTEEGAQGPLTVKAADTDLGTEKTLLSLAAGHGKTVVEIPIDAYSLAKTLIISSGEKEISYSFANYAHGIESQTTETVAALLDALYTYGFEAYSYYLKVN